MNANTYAASQGATQLDERVPGWFNQINLAALDLSVGTSEPNKKGVPSCGCVCAQLDLVYIQGSTRARNIRSREGYYGEGMWSLGFKRIFRVRRLARGFTRQKWDTVDLGFSAGTIVLPDGNFATTSFTGLTQAWKDLIKERRASQV